MAISYTRVNNNDTSTITITGIPSDWSGVYVRWNSASSNGILSAIPNETISIEASAFEVVLITVSSGPTSGFPVQLVVPVTAKVYGVPYLIRVGRSSNVNNFYFYSPVSVNSPYLPLSWLLFVDGEAVGELTELSYSESTLYVSGGRYLDSAEFSDISSAHDYCIAGLSDNGRLIGLSNHVYAGAPSTGAHNTKVLSWDAYPCTVQDCVIRALDSEYAFSVRGSSHMKAENNMISTDRLDAIFLDGGGRISESFNEYE